MITPHTHTLTSRGDQRSVAFFDLDRTLIDINSGTLWVRAEYRAGFISTAQLIQASWWLFKYQFGWIELEHALLSAIQALKGQEEHLFSERTARFYEQKIKHRVRPEATQTIQRHQQRGERCVLLTTSSQYLSRHLIRDLSLHGGLYNRFEVKEGRFTGAPEGELCFGTGKLKAALDYVEPLDIDLSVCSFYTDSYADLPLLEVVGRPYVVCPDQKLYKVAQRRGWPILKWSPALS